MFHFQVWILPILLLAATTALAIPVSRYCAWIMDGKYRAPAGIRWLESLLNTGPQNWKQYALAFMLFNLVMFLFGFAVLSLQPVADLGLNPETLRGWVRQAEADDGSRSDRLSAAEREELAALRREVKDLRRSNEILKSASVFFARELDQPRTK